MLLLYSLIGVVLVLSILSTIVFVAAVILGSRSDKHRRESGLDE
jgi:hypothetical protein